MGFGPGVIFFIRGPAFGARTERDRSLFGRFLAAWTSPLFRLSSRAIIRALGPIVRVDLAFSAAYTTRVSTPVDGGPSQKSENGA